MNDTQHLQTMLDKKLGKLQQIDWRDMVKIHHYTYF